MCATMRPVGKPLGRHDAHIAQMTILRANDANERMCVFGRERERERERTPKPDSGYALDREWLLTIIYRIERTKAWPIKSGNR